MGNLNRENKMNKEVEGQTRGVFGKMFIICFDQRADMWVVSGDKAGKTVFIFGNARGSKNISIRN